MCSAWCAAFRSLLGPHLSTSKADLRHRERSPRSFTSSTCCREVCVAPATADIIAKAAVGLADEIVSTTMLAFHGPIIVAPAMNVQMWRKPPVQRNMIQLRADGMVIVGPESGHLSCGEVGEGRMAEPDAIFEVIAEQFGGLAKA